MVGRLDLAIIAHRALAARLRAAGVPDAGASARELLRANPSPDNEEALETMVVRREKREPLQYILGEWDFLHLQCVRVRAPVLCPRPETEELVRLAARVLAQRQQQERVERPLRLLEVGTGSGVVSIALLGLLRGATATALDVCPVACALARENAARFGVSERVSVELADAFKWDAPSPPFDALVANVPYVPDSELRDGAIQPELTFESDLALRGGAPDGLGFTLGLLERIAGKGWLLPDAPVLLETHSTHPAALAAALAPELRGQALRLEPASDLGRGIDTLVPPRGPVDESSAEGLRGAGWRFVAGFSDAFEQPRFVQLALK
jgi:release factor glutamine methyltransferase